MKRLLKENYKAENYIVRDSAKRTVYCEIYRGGKTQISVLEDEFSENGKLRILDSHTDGLCTYILNLIGKYNEARGNEIKLTQYGGIHKASFGKWRKENDIRKVTSDPSYMVKSYPTYWLFGSEYRLVEDTPTTDFGHERLYNGKSVINQWFHDLLIQLENEENKHFKENDPYQLKINKVKELYKYVKEIEDFHNQELSDIYYNDKRDNISEEKLDKYINVLDDIRNYINEKVNQLKED